MKWSEMQTYQFVKQYMKHENLWNIKHEHYKVSNIRTKSYKEFISEFCNVTGIDLNIAELKIKIKSLRSTYTQELAKIKRRSVPDSTYRSNLKWFPIWHKCFVNIKKEDQDCAYDDTQDINEDPIDDSSEVWASQTDNVRDNIPTVDPFTENGEYNIIFKEEPTDSFTEQDHPSPSKIKKKKFKHRSPSVEFSDNTFRGSMDSSESMKEDEFDIYGKYIATQLRNMDLQKALRVQLEIQSLVSEARISDLVEK